MANRLLKKMMTISLLGAGFSNVHAATVEIKGYGQHIAGSVVYHYQVINNRAADKQDGIVRIELGRESSSSERGPELDIEPVGDTMEDGVTAPTGWVGHMSGEEDQPRNTIVWEINNPNGSNMTLVEQYKIPSGQSLREFSVTLPRKDASYLNSHFFVITNRSDQISGVITPIDTTAPSLLVTVAPTVLWPPNGKPVKITVNVVVKDDYDLAPDVKLESITANEALEANDIQDAQFGTDDRQFSLIAKRAGTNQAGRIYTITYSATDASGLKATASATITVPHDQGK